MQIFLDESGYTGQDLLNLEQPVFTIATLRLPEEECTELKARFFGKVRAQELKYTSLARRPRQQQMVLAFLREILPRKDALKVSLCAKRFAVVTKMVDYLTETAAYQDGVNLYRDGGHLALSNLLWYGLPSICGRDYFDRLLIAFQAAVRDRTWESFTNFRRILFDSSLTEEQKKWLVWFQAPILRWGFAFFRDLKGEELELALTCSSFLMGRWRFQHRDEPIVLIHDESSNMARLEHIWAFFMSKERLPHERDWGGGRTTIYPIGVEQTVLASSTAWSGLQLADVIAGAFADGARWAISGDASDRYRDELWHGALVAADTELPIWPRPEVVPSELGTLGTDVSETLDYVTSEMMRMGFDPDVHGKST